jgi:hypothetical protein
LTFPAVLLSCSAILLLSIPLLAKIGSEQPAIPAASRG